MEAFPFRGLPGVVFKPSVQKRPGNLIACAEVSEQAGKRLDLAFGDWRNGTHGWLRLRNLPDVPPLPIGKASPKWCWIGGG